MAYTLKTALLSHLPVLSMLMIYLGASVSSGQRHRQTRELSATFEVLEESPAQSYVGNVAIGAGLDQIYNSTALNSFEFGFIRQSGHNTDYFHIESDTGILRTSQPIDRDERCPGKADCSISIVVAIQKPVEFFRAIAVTINLIDTNDNSPTFNPSEYSIKFSESDPVGTSRSLPIALDMDSPRFGVFDYQLTTEVNEFRLRKTINSGSGLTELKLVLVLPLDRETVDTYMLRINSTDGGAPPKTGTLLIDIAVEDDNDHSPEFENDSYSIEVSESISANVTFFTLSAADPDAGDNGKVEYHFAPITASLYRDQFRLHKDLGHLSLKKNLDYETMSSYHLEVVAADKAPNARSTLAQIELSVLDINDNYPEITVSTLNDKEDAEILENLPQGKQQVVAHVFVYDADIGENGNVMCGLSHPSFDLIPTSQNLYKIVTDDRLDREAVGSYILKVECYDMGDPSLSSSKDLTVNVLDDNDHSPVFHPSQYSEVIRENNMIDAYIIRVNANDSDIGPNAHLRYAIVEPGVSKYVYIQEISGVVRAATVLDYEQIQKIEFTVVVRDQGDPPRSATTFVTINIMDTNDEPPRFDHAHYEFSILENVPENTLLGHVTAFDLDSPLYNIFEYSASPRHHEDQGAFHVDIISGGIISLMKFDREERDVFYLTVFANDVDNPSLIGSASVTIYVKDENDNDPFITYPEIHNRTFDVSSHSPEGYNITQITAVDADTDDNARLTFSILSGDERGLFAIDHTSGLLSTKSELSDIVYEQIWLRITVRDSGRPVKYDTIDILIVVDSALPYIPPEALGEEMVRKSNLMVIIVVAAVSGFIIVVLIIAIALLKTLDRRRFQGKEYNCRTEEQKILNDLNVKAVEANGNLHARERMEQSSMGNSTPTSQTKLSGSLGRKKDMSSATMELEEMGCPHVVRNNMGEEVPSPHAEVPHKHGQDRHLEAHLMALLKQDQDADSASSADMSNADSGRGASEEGEGGSRYISIRLPDPSTIPCPPNPPHGYQQARHIQHAQGPVSRVPLRPDTKSANPGHMYAHGHTVPAHSPGRSGATTTFQPRKSSSEANMHKPGSGYRTLGTVETRASLQSLPSYSHARSLAGQKHVTFTGNGASNQSPCGYHTTGGHHGRHLKLPPHPKGVDSVGKSRNVDSSGYGSLRSGGHASQSSPKEEVWQHRRRHRDHPLRDITEEEDNNSRSEDDIVDSTQLCQQIDEIFFKQKSVIV